MVLRARSVLIALSLLAASVPASAEPGAAGGPSAAREAAVEALFERLRGAGSADEARALGRQVMVHLLISGSATVDLLMQRAIEAMEAEEHGLALQLLDSILALKPDFAEAWNKRATINWKLENFGESLADIQRTLDLEPRHFGALIGLGILMREVGEEERALKAFEEALAVHPFLPDAKQAVERLRREVDGQDI